MFNMLRKPQRRLHHWPFRSGGWYLRWGGAKGSKPINVRLLWSWEPTLCQ